MASRRLRGRVRAGHPLVRVAVWAALLVALAASSSRVLASPGAAGASSAASAGTPSGSPTAAEPTASPTHVAPSPRHIAGPPLTLPSVGPLFAPGEPTHHMCTAAVVDSGAGDVVLTAAHCIAGSGQGVVFAPGYHDGQAPYGLWSVQRVYVAAAWESGQDPHADYAFLVVTALTPSSGSASVQEVVGGNRLGRAPATGQRVTVAAYPSTRDDAPVICPADVHRTAEYPTFDCGGYTGGTSGGPWLAGFDAGSRTGTITAVIGGLRQGGCIDSTSYSPVFTADTDQVMARAVADAPADDVPAAGSDGC